MEKLFITNMIEIKAPANKVWLALTQPEHTKKYMFGCETVSDWKVGSALLWKGSYEGKEMVFVKGFVSDIQPGRFLAYTVFDPNNTAIPDLPENYLTVTYSLEETNGITQLTVTQGDYNAVAEGKKRYEESYNKGEGWDPILKQLKEVVESEH